MRAALLSLALALPLAAQESTPLVERSIFAEPDPAPSPSPSAPPESPRFDFSIMGGTTVPVLSDAGGLVGNPEQDGKTKLSPLILVTVETPISSFANGPDLVVGAEYGSGPGQSLVIDKPETYNSFGMHVGLSQSLSDKLYFALYAECGFETRLSGDTEPRDKAPRYCGGGLRFKGHDSELALMLNADQRLSSSADVPVPKAGAAAPVAPVDTLAYRPTVSIRAQVPLYVAKDGKLGGAKVSAYAKVLLGMDWSRRGSAPTGGRHDVVLVGIIAGI